MPKVLPPAELFPAKGMNIWIEDYLKKHRAALDSIPINVVRATGAGA